MIFHPRLAGRDEHHLIQAELPEGLLGGDQVAVMDGIERPAHDPEPSRLVHWGILVLGIVVLSLFLSFSVGRTALGRTTGLSPARVRCGILTR
jgi:hypothetical protein